MARRTVQKVIKIGSSLGVVLPVEVCRGLCIERGDSVAFAVYETDSVMIRKLSRADLEAMKPRPIEWN